MFEVQDGAVAMPADSRHSSSAYRSSPQNILHPETLVENSANHTSHRLGVLEDISTRYSGSGSSSNLDWAIVTIETQNLCGPNRLTVRNPDGSSRDLFSEAIATTVPEDGVKVLFATTRGLTEGVSASSVSAVKIGSDKVVRNVWTIRQSRMESGDCGCWAFHAMNGNLLGMVFATCGALSETYIIPARDIFVDIQAKSGKKAITLPSSGLSTGAGVKVLDGPRRMTDQAPWSESEKVSCSCIEPFLAPPPPGFHQLSTIQTDSVCHHRSHFLLRSRETLDGILCYHSQKLFH